jgi:hypothetical protein
MERRYLPKLITMEDWVAKAHPDAPALPWRGDEGQEICSFAVVPLSETAGLTIVLFDAYGCEVVRHGDARAILVTCLALNPTPWELTFLPARAAALSSRMRARVRKPIYSPATAPELPLTPFTGPGSRTVRKGPALR